MIDLHVLKLEPLLISVPKTIHDRRAGLITSFENHMVKGVSSILDEVHFRFYL